MLSDVVRVIRTFRPDIIITRFPPTREAGHGHHEASAILAEEAFKLAGDPTAFPEQLKQGVEVWQPRRLFFNGSTWWKKNLAEIAKPDSGWYTVDVGGYDPLLGLSYTEIAGRSRSMHKSQGFGAAETRGEMLEYLKLIGGDKPKTTDIFEGIDMTWGRVKGGADVGRLVDRMIADFNMTAPQNSAVILGEFEIALSQHPEMRDAVNKHVGLRDLTGLSAEALYAYPTIALGDSLHARIELVNRSDRHMDWNALPNYRSQWFPQDHSIGLSAGEHRTETVNTGPWSLNGAIDEPTWLKEKHGNLYVSSKADLIDPHEMTLEYSLFSVFADAAGSSYYCDLPLTYKWVDRVDGERIRPVYVTPVASVIPEKTTWLIKENGGIINVSVEALTDDLSGTLSCSAPKGWLITPPSCNVGPLKRGERATFTFMHQGSNQPQPGSLKFLFTSADGQSKSNKGLHEIDYPHIMPQVYYTPAEVKLVPLQVETTAKTVGYIKGAGDEVPQAIEQLGATVDFLEPATATLETISKYDAIVVGIRAYNNNQGMKRFNPVLMRYVENGGTVVVQYTTRTSDMVLPDSLIGPYPFKLTRDRVTVEEAPPTFLAKDHPLLNTPNKIASADFDGWVQERGLYFCGSLDPHYTPLIAWNDPGEQPMNGGLITCDHGKGRYVYTGISFFRQLPAGVPGAYRLFANLISKREE